MNIRPLGLVVLIFCTAILVAVQFNNHTDTKYKSGWKAKKRKKFQEFDKPLRFIELHREMRTPDDRTDPAYRHGYRLRELMRAKQHSKTTAAQARTNASIEWTERGPGNVPGRTRALLDLSTAQTNAFLAGAATGGIWKTSDGGASWSEKNDNLSSLPISSFAANKDLTRIYAGTGEFVSSIFSAIGDGIMVSTDLGETWNVLPSTQGNNDFAIVTRIIVDPDNANTILCTTTRSSLQQDVGKSFVLRSTDGGSTWQKALQTDNPLEQIIASPDDFSIQYASENSVGVWKSVDGGMTWALSQDGMFPDGRIEMAISPVNTNRIFASAEGTLSDTESDMYMSTDAGETWALVKLKFNGRDVDFLGNDPATPDSQGFYDNAIMCDPFNEKVVYVGGVNLFQFTVTDAGDPRKKYVIDEENTPFLVLQSFSNFTEDNGRLQVGTLAANRDVEIRFGPGITQKAHRFTVPVDRTSGVQSTAYSYQEYVEVPFQVWDVSANRQLMASFRDQNRNGVFDLVPRFLTSDGTEYLRNSREYLYIHDENYQNQDIISGIATTAGHEYRLMYSIFPALPDNQTWNAQTLPVSRIVIKTNTIPLWKSTTLTVADSYGNFDSKNILDQANLDRGVHPDHHCMVAVKGPAANQYKILLGNDGGVFVSDVSTTPGTTDKSWTFQGWGYNTSQFYGADKKPGGEEYIGGLQDNGTRISPKGAVADAASRYRFAIAGDGFEVLWNSRDSKRILGTTYYGNIFQSVDGGTTFNDAVDGLTPGSEFPFLTKLSHSKDLPERVFTVSARGVHVSQNFGKRWTLTSIPQKFVTTSASLLDVEVSRANANVIWAGSGMSDQTSSERYLFLSKDGGKTFAQTSNYNGTVMGSITKLASHPTEAATAYALFSFSGKPKILRTEDYGETWEDLSGFEGNQQSSNGFPDVAVYSLYVRADDPNILWAGTEIGIFESVNNGESWAIVQDFPKVSVWDMKGQDNQIVIATHGRGIWTATLDQQSNLIPTTEIVAAGTSPSGKPVIRIQVPELKDSVIVMVGTTQKKVLKNVNSGTHDLILANATTGLHEMSLISYTNGAPVQSPVRNVNFLDLLAVKRTHSTAFKTVNDFYTSGFFLQRFPDAAPAERQNLQTIHPYAVDQEYIAMLKHPVIISGVMPIVYYRDVAIVEPVNDYATLEATRNGLDWLPIIAPYDSRKNPAWETAYTGKQPGKSEMLTEHNADLTVAGNPGDTLLLRWRLHSNEANTGWGWAIDYVAVQEVPVAAETPLIASLLGVFPNPANRAVNLRYSLSQPSRVTIRMTTMLGSSVLEVELDRQLPGLHEYHLPLDHLPSGNYVLAISANGKKDVTKLVVTR